MLSTGNKILSELFGLKMFYFTFNLEIYFLSRYGILVNIAFLSDVVPLPSSFIVSENVSNSSYLYSVRWCNLFSLAASSKTFSLSTVFSNLIYFVLVFIRFSLFGVPWVSWICGFVVLSRFRNLGAIFSSSIFPVCSSVSSPLATPITWYCPRGHLNSLHLVRSIFSLSHFR